MRNLDTKLLIAVIFLAVFGLVMMSSISISSSFDVSGRNDFYFWRHFRYLIVGIPAALLAFKFPLERLRQWSILFFMIGIALLLMTIVMGHDSGTMAKLWLKLGPVSFQPVEAVKLAVIIFLAAIFSSGKLTPDTIEGGFMPFAVAIGIPSIFLVIQSDFGSLLVLVLTAAVMYFAAGANLKHFFGGAAIAGVFATIVTFAVPYVNRRVMVFLNPELDPLNTGYQVEQALIAIGSGKWFGRGFQNSIQKFDYLPEVQSDTIFSAISEEMGFFRIVLLLGIYAFIAWRGFKIAQNVHDEFQRYLAIGLTTWIVGQAIINIGVNLALLPNTGITLPFLSYGGTSLVMTLAAAGLLLQISTHTSVKKRRWY